MQTHTLAHTHAHTHTINVHTHNHTQLNAHMHKCMQTSLQEGHKVEGIKTLYALEQMSEDPNCRRIEIYNSCLYDTPIRCIISRWQRYKHTHTRTVEIQIHTHMHPHTHSLTRTHTNRHTQTHTHIHEHPQVEQRISRVTGMPLFREFSEFRGSRF